MVIFTDLPFELRTKIYRTTLQTPRVLQIIRKSPKPQKTDRTLSTLFRKLDIAPDPNSLPIFTISPSSYGKFHPVILSINRESRAEALRILTKHLDVYWNLPIDFAYFEIHQLTDVRAMYLTQMYKMGLLDPFCNVALDNLMWCWPEYTTSLEFRRVYGRSFEGIISPIKILNAMPCLEEVAVIFTSHERRADLVIPYQSWRLGILNEESTLSRDIEGHLSQFNVRDSIREKGFVERYPRNGLPVYFRIDESVDVSLQGIHGRARELYAWQKRALVE